MSLFNGSLEPPQMQTVGSVAELSPKVTSIHHLEPLEQQLMRVGGGIPGFCSGGGGGEGGK